MHNAQDIIRIFNELFSETEKTRLVKGDSEPLYLPASKASDVHQIIFAHGFFASALHEIAHWCIAGASRRALVDYGYWYEPSSRGVETQDKFAHVEARPQALEWIFHQAAGHYFVVSLDNVTLEHQDFTPFKLAIMAEVEALKKNGLPPRAALFQKALAAFYGQHGCVKQYHFCQSIL